MIFQLLLNSICCFLDFDECGFLESEWLINWLLMLWLVFFLTIFLVFFFCFWGSRICFVLSSWVRIVSMSVVSLLLARRSGLSGQVLWLLLLFWWLGRGFLVNWFLGEGGSRAGVFFFYTCEEKEQQCRDCKISRLSTVVAPLLRSCTQEAASSHWCGRRWMGVEHSKRQVCSVRWPTPFSCQRDRGFLCELLEFFFPP